MESNKTALAWLVAAIFMGTTALFAWQYVRASNETAAVRNETDALRADYEQLQQRLEDQQAGNAALLRDVHTMQAELERALTQIQSLQEHIGPPAIPPAPPE